MDFLIVLSPRTRSARRVQPRGKGAHSNVSSDGTYLEKKQVAHFQQIRQW